MDAWDRLEVAEMLIKRFDQRTDLESFDRLIAVGTDVLCAINENQTLIDYDYPVRVRAQLNEVLSYRGTRKNDLQTLRAFDYYKIGLLQYINNARRLILDIEG